MPETARPTLRHPDHPIPSGCEQNLSPSSFYLWTVLWNHTEHISSPLLSHDKPAASGRQQSYALVLPFL